MAKGQEELVVITRAYDLVLWSCHHTSRFPRNHHFVLGERIERFAADLDADFLEEILRGEGILENP
jgi:hypothetical protein